MPRLLAALVLAVAACGGTSGVHPGSAPPPAATDGGDPGADLSSALGGDSTPDATPDAGAPAVADLAATPLGPGVSARVTASALNLRSGPGTTNAILTVMKCGDAVSVVAGPMNAYWWNVSFTSQGKTTVGWASGNYLVSESAFDPSICLGAVDAGASPDGGMSVDQMSVIARAKLGVGYSYYWGHGSWRSDGQQPGSCMGNCGACTHMGPYGADCSGFVAKCWQIPSPSPLTTDLHPYSTYNFFNDTTHWAPPPRAS